MSYVDMGTCVEMDVVVDCVVDCVVDVSVNCGCNNGNGITFACTFTFLGSILDADSDTTDTDPSGGDTALKYEF